MTEEVNVNGVDAEYEEKPMKAAELFKEIKDLGWGKIVLSKAGFGGATHEFQSSNGGKVAVLFATRVAYVLRDENGLFSLSDLYKYVIKDSSMNIENPNSIEFTEVVADAYATDVAFNDATIESLGLGAEDIKEDIARRLKSLSRLDLMVEKTN